MLVKIKVWAFFTATVAAGKCVDYMEAKRINELNKKVIIDITVMCATAG